MIADTLNLRSRDLDTITTADITDGDTIRHLHLDYNNLTTIRDLSLPALTELTLNGNDLVSFSCRDCSLPNLDSLHLVDNDLKSLRVDESYPNLECLNVKGNMLSYLPAELYECELLRVLNAEENAISYLPSTFGHLRHLEVCDLSYNTLRRLPDNFGCLQALRILNLSENKLEHLPNNISELPNIEEVLHILIILYFS